MGPTTHHTTLPSFSLLSFRFTLLFLAPLLTALLLSSSAAATQREGDLYSIHSSLSSLVENTAWDVAQEDLTGEVEDLTGAASHVRHVSRVLRMHSGFGTGMHAQGRASNDRSLGRILVRGTDGSRGRSVMALLKKVTPIVRRGCTLLVGGPTGFKTVQAAVNRIGLNSGVTRKTICILPGVYRENILIRPGQNGITLRGSGMGNTKIVASRRQTSKLMDPLSAGTLIVHGSAFRGENLTIENDFKNITIPSPAVALMGNLSSWEKVAFVAWDDTLGIQTSRHIFKDCVVAGEPRYPLLLPSLFPIFSLSPPPPPPSSTSLPLSHSPLLISHPLLLVPASYSQDAGTRSRGPRLCGAVFSQRPLS